MSENNLKSNLYEQIITEAGGTVDDLPDHLESTYMNRLLETVKGGGGEKVRSMKLFLDTTKSCYNMFYKYTGETIPDGIFEYNDTSNVTKMNSMFYSSEKLKTVSMPDTSKVLTVENIFASCSNLETVTGLNLIKARGTNALYNAFIWCTNLTNVTLYNIQANLQIGSGTTYGHLLTIDSLVNTCKECIKQSSSRTLTVGSANLTKLSSVYVKFTDPSQTEIAVGEKGDIVVCESTDEGAMLISDYMQLKSWALA